MKFKHVFAEKICQIVKFPYFAAGHVWLSWACCDPRVQCCVTLMAVMWGPGATVRAMLKGLGVAWALTLLLGALGEQEQGARGPEAGDEAGGNPEEEGPPLTALKYLGQYGHLTQPNGNFSLFDRWNIETQFDSLTAGNCLDSELICSLFSFEDGLRSFQKWVGLNQSGTLDRW